MLEMILSVLLFILFFIVYCMLFKKVIKNIYVIPSFILALAMTDMESPLFIFEIYFVFVYFVFYLLSKVACFTLTKKRVCLMMAGALFIAGMSTSYGIYNMKNIQETRYDVYTRKTLSKDYTLVMISDLHYPATMNLSQLKQFVQRIAHDDTDMILLLGDIVDEHTTCNEMNDVFAMFGTLTKQSQVYYVFGNHDTGTYGYKKNISYDQLKTIISRNHIQVLEDESIGFNEEITLYGRLDASFKHRKKLNELLLKNDPDHFLIMLDHRPEQLQENAGYGVDLHLSGHCHAGQIFPLYFFYELFHVNELNYGKKAWNQMTAINSSGAGGWGFPVRTENHSEYVVVNIHQNK